MASDQTVRYRAGSRSSYSLALVALVQLARDEGPEFVFGPLDLETLEDNGLTVSGPDLKPVSDVLARIPGLTEVPA